MGRTAESYLKEADTKPIEMLYPFVTWSDERLWARAHEIQDDPIKHGVERGNVLRREVAHLCFELAARINEE